MFWLLVMRFMLQANLVNEHEIYESSYVFLSISRKAKINSPQIYALHEIILACTHESDVKVFKLSQNVNLNENNLAET